MIAVLERPDVLDGVPRVITSEAQNERYTSALLQLERRGNLTAAEKNLAEVLTLLIEAYEEEHYPIRSASAVEVLKELMEANNLRQKDLAPMLGSESVGSEVLHSNRKIESKAYRETQQAFQRFSGLIFLKLAGVSQ